MSRDRRAHETKAQLLASPHGAPANPGASENQQTVAGREPSTPGSDQASTDNRSSAASDQLAGQSDQLAGDGDRAAGDSDQLAGDGDRAAGDSAQAAGDRDLAGGDDSEAHAPSRDVRERAAHHRQHTAEARLDAGAARDRVADARDQTALTRDRAAAARELAIDERDIVDQHAHARPVSGAEIVLRAGAERRRAATRRAAGIEQLALAALDRQAAAGDREHAAAQRRHALADREALAYYAAIIETDALTGARTREAGLIELDQERDRCHRTGAGLLLAYVHIDAPCAAGDIRGHDAGDELLKRVVASMHDHLRSYDLIVRFAASDVVCAMSNMTVPTAQRRFDTIAAVSGNAMRTGFAALTSRQSTKELITRAQSTAR